MVKVLHVIVSIDIFDNVVAYPMTSLGITRNNVLLIFVLNQNTVSQV